MSSSKPLNTQNYSPVNLEALRPVQPNEFLPPVGHWATLGGVAMLAIFGAAVALAAVLKYPATVKAPVNIRPMGELRIIQAAATGKVNRLHVKANQVVQQGEAIASLDDSRLQSQKLQLLSSIRETQRQLKQIEAQKQALQAQMTAEKQVIGRAIAAATAELKLNQRQHQQRQLTTQAEMREAKAAAQLAQEELARYQELANTGAITKLQISEKAAVLEAALARLQRTQAALNPSAASVDIAGERIAQERARGASTLATLNKERQALIQQTARLQNELTRDRQELQQVETELGNTVIRSSVNGTIQQLNLRNVDQLVQLGDVVAQLAPKDVPLVVKAFVAVQEIGRVEVGQTVNIKVSGCPYPDYGTLAGRVITISPDAIAPQSDQAIATTQVISRAHYEVTIQPQTLFLKTDASQCNLQAGMDGSADIITRKETVLTFFFRKMRLLTGV
ncbi:MAG: HlyD family efflux transporter periplasmic adaptor subunit [Mojavia pulchra JT2-VF2]|jgi:HlyD family secretion protein|uniref:HlyD family efflux transporter periplasmic adaptor subunit n=1 Tax=Mojavia pulchra JT2-VF2 TaxID=287848 RepID=A0A951PZH6_9NOST|nr:HlyD family efflux transporter periplasmic adaptor subunit [Mojavia pulchra JT2-VF2]